MSSSSVPGSGGPRKRRLALVTDAWRPQTNGVVNTLSRLVAHLETSGMDVKVISPEGHRTLPFPSYPEVRVACTPWRAASTLQEFRPDAVHIATEGPIGIWIRRFMVRRNLAFTTSFHTRFPEYLSARLPVPLEWGYRIERWFHGKADRTLVGTETMIRELKARRVGNQLIHWPRGVDTDLFRPDRRREDLYPFKGPIWLYVGRVAVEKSLPDFLALPLPGTKVVVGDGPMRAELQARFPEVVWLGYRFDEELAAHYASADCFVFPSRTETFGNVILEAMASGLPVAALPSPGPSDLIRNGDNGVVAPELFEACLRARSCSRVLARATALRYSWAASHELFRSQLVPMVRNHPLAFLNSARSVSP